MSRRRIWAIARKELREYRRNRSIIVTMGIYPVIFAIQPLIAILRTSSLAAGPLAREHVLLYMLGIPTLVPAFLAAIAVAGERQQGTLEPALTTPIRSEEFLLGKAIAALIPALGVSYVVFAAFLAIVALFAAPSVAPALIQGPDLLAQIAFTPLLAGWTIWVGIAMSTRANDVRVAQQLAVLITLPALLAIIVVAIGLIEPSPRLAFGAAALLFVLDVGGWRLVSRLFDRERLIAGQR